MKPTKKDIKNMNVQLTRIEKKVDEIISLTAKTIGVSEDDLKLWMLHNEISRIHELDESNKRIIAQAKAWRKKQGF